MYDIEDARGVPVSAGVPPLVTIAGIVGVIMIFIVGAMVIVTAHSGHIWPSINSTKIPLP